MIELMIAVVVLTVGLVFILQSVSSGIRVVTCAQNRFLAACIATGKLEDLEEIELTENGLEQESFSEEEVIKSNKVFKVFTEVTPQPIDMEKFPQNFLPGKKPDVFLLIEDRLQKVAVRVSWQERAASQQLLLTTYLNTKQIE